MATMTPNYLPMNLPSGAPPPMAGGGAMGKGGGRPGGRPGMGGKGGGSTSVPPFNPSVPPLNPRDATASFTPPPPPAPGQPRFYTPGPPGMFDPVPEPQQQVPSNLLSTMPQLGMGGVQQQQTNVEVPNYVGASNQQLADAAMGLGQQFNAQPTSAGGAMSMLNQAIGGSQQPISPFGSQELMNAARNQFGVARRQPPRMMPGGGGRQFDPAPAPQRQPGLFNYLDLFSGG